MIKLEISEKTLKNIREKTEQYDLLLNSNKYKKLDKVNLISIKAVSPTPISAYEVITNFKNDSKVLSDAFVRRSQDAQNRPIWQFVGEIEEIKTLISRAFIGIGAVKFVSPVKEVVKKTNEVKKNEK